MDEIEGLFFVDERTTHTNLAFAFDMSTTFHSIVEGCKTVQDS